LKVLEEDEKEIQRFISENTNDLGEFHVKYIRYGKKVSEKDKYVEKMTREVLRRGLFRSVSSSGSNENQEYTLSIRK